MTSFEEKFATSCKLSAKQPELISLHQSSKDAWLYKNRYFTFVHELIIDIVDVNLL